MKAMSPNGILKDDFLINGTLVAAKRFYNRSDWRTMFAATNEYTIFFLLKSMVFEHIISSERASNERPYRLIFKNKTVEKHFLVSRPFFIQPFVTALHTGFCC